MEVKLTSNMFEQGSISTQINGSLLQAKTDSDTAIRSKELIPVMSERTVTLTGNPSGLDVKIVEFNKDQKMIAMNVWKTFGFSWGLSFDTVYIALVMAIPGGQSLTRPFMVDTLSRIELETEWRNITVNEWKGIYGLDSSKTLQEWGFKAGDTLTFSTRIKTNSGKKLSARIQWYKSDSDRYSVYGNIIQNGEGISTVTGVIPAGYSRVDLFIDAHETHATIKDITEEQVKDGILVLGSSIPQNLDRGGVLVMSEYPALPIVKGDQGFEYAEGMNLWLYSRNEDFGGELGIWKRELKDSGDVPSGKFVRCTFENKGNFSHWGPYSTGSKYSHMFVINAPMTLSLYVRASKAITLSMSVEFANRSKTIDLNTQWQKVDFNVICKLTPESQGYMAVCFYSAKWEIGDYIDISSPMLTYGSKVHPYRPNPADLVGGGLPMSIIARGLPLTVRNSIDEAIQNSAAQLEQRLSTSIAQTGESIKNEVSQQYYAKGDTDKLIAEASTILEQKYNSFEMSFNSFKQMVDNNQNLTNLEFATITKFIRFIDGNIFLGEEGNNQMLKIEKDRISFLQGNQEVAYISDSALYIYDGVFLNSLRIGNFAFVPRANGSLDFKKVR